MFTPTDLKYSADHAWVRVKSGEATLGITDFAQRELGEIVYVDVGLRSGAIEAGDELGSVESVKAVSALFSPVSGTVVATNADTFDTDPELLNTDPYGDGWIMRIELSNPKELDELMTAAKYEAFIKSEEGG